MSRAGWLRVMAWMLLLAAATLFPFDFFVSQQTDPYGSVTQSGIERLVDAWNLNLEQKEFVLNVLLFVPFGVLLHHERQRRSSGPMLIGIAVAAGFSISFGIECLQAFLPRRDSSVIDLVSNTSGAVAGALGHRAWGSRVGAGVARWRAQTSPVLLVGLLAGFTVMALGASAALQLRTRLGGWSVDYPLLVGNEPTGDRPWRGRLFAFELTDAATPLESVRRFAGGAAAHIPGVRMAVFDFSGSPPYRDSTGNLPALDWTTRPSQPTAAMGVSLPGRPWLRTEVGVSTIARRLNESNAFTLRVLCATNDPNQGGPARILSQSVSPGLRNFTLGQLGDDMVFRFRTPHTGLNGARPEIVIPDVFSDEGRREVLVTYDGATLLAAVSDSGRVHGTELTPGSSLALSLTNLTVQADELQFLTFVYLVGLFFLPGMLVGLLGRTARHRMVAVVLWVPVFAVLLEGTLVLASGRPFDWGRVAANGCVGAAVLTAAVLLCGTSGQPRRRLVLRPQP